MSTVRCWGLAPLVLLCLAFGVSSAKASPIIYSYTGLSSGGESVKVEADFDLSVPGTISITLKNLFVNPHDDGQNLSGLSFTLNSGQNSGTLTGSSAILASVTSNTLPPTFTGPKPTGWVLFSEPVGMKLDVLVGPGHAGPAHTLIGHPDSFGLYSDANNSIKTAAHNPFLWETANYTVTVSGTAPTNVPSVTFWFGTVEGGDNVVLTNNGPVVPEPTSLALSGIGCVGLLGFWAARRKRQVAA